MANCFTCEGYYTGGLTCSWVCKEHDEFGDTEEPCFEYIYVKEDIYE